MRTALILLLLGASPGATSFAAPSILEPPTDRRESRRCLAVRVEAVQNPSLGAKPRRRFGRRFSAANVLDLRFVVKLRANDPAGLVEIKLFTPSGRLYDVVAARADHDSPTSGQAPRRRTRVVTARVPVAGSHITDRSLYGDWIAAVHLDGNEKGCRRKRFILEP